MNSGGKAIFADGIKVTGEVHLRDDFKAEGEVRFLEANIGGSLSCINGQFLNSGEGKIAINADRIKVLGSVFLREGFKAEGEVRLLGAYIGSILSCIDGQFLNANGKAINLNRVKVIGSVFLRDGFKAEGEVRLLGAEIGGNLDCINAQFNNTGGKALTADWISIRGSVLIRKGFKSEGRVSFRQARIDLGFQCKGVTDPQELLLDLKGARIGTLYDEKESWPPAGALSLHSLTYDDIDNNSPHDAKSRLDWLRRQPKDQWSPQPYEQLAKVLRESGHEEDAKKILIAKNDDKIKFTEMPWYKKILYWIFGKTVGYGYQPLKALLWMVCFVALGGILFGLGSSQQAMEPLTKIYPDFNCITYSLDTFLPLVDLQQASYWHPLGPFLRTYLWFHIMAGWALTSLFVGGLTRLIRS